MSSRFRLRSCLPILVVGLLAVTALAAACSDGGGGLTSAAFEVNGQTTSQADFNRELDALADNAAFAEAFQGTGSQIRNSEGTVNAELAAQWATLVIQQQILAGAVGDITDEDRAEAASEAAGLFGSPEVFDAFPEWFRDEVTDRMAAQVAYLRGGDVDEEEVRRFYDENLESLVANCPSGKFVSHILVETSEEAEEVVAELDGGAPFAEVARERSTDPGSGANGGFLDCFQAGSYVPEFEAAVNATAPGERSAPAQSQFGFHIVLIEAEPSFEAMRGQIESSLGQQVSQEAYRTLVDESAVEVNPRYGSWVVDEAGARVMPPEVPEDDAPDEDLPEIDLDEVPPPPSS